MFASVMLLIAQNAAYRAELRQQALTLDAEFPHNGCASLMAALMMRGGLSNFIPEEQVLALDEELISRGWLTVDTALAQPGDIAICNVNPKTGRYAHMFLIVARKHDDDVCLILDNQSELLHYRSLSGENGKTPVHHVLRTNW